MARQRKFDWEEAKRLYEAGGWTRAQLAKRFGVSWTAIYFATNPEAYEKAKRASSALNASGTCEECGGRCTRLGQWQRRGRELCRKCASRIYNRTRFRTNPDTGLPQVRCQTCRQWKGYAEFHGAKNRSEGLGGQCRACGTEAKRDWRKRNPEKQRAYDRAYRDVRSKKVA